MPFSEDPTIDRSPGRPPSGQEDSATGSRIGPYTVGALLGEGGFGSVYLAEQAEPVRRRVALKLIRPGMDSRAVIARFEAERQALAIMDHPGLATVYDAGVTPEGRPYFAMELVQGEPLDRFCDLYDLGLEDRIRLAIQIAEAAHHAHMKGVVHRDLKPSNILVEMVDRRPVAKIIDFGVAKALTQPLTETPVLTESGQMIGTPEYMSPEQARGGTLDVDIRADVYSIGAMLYQLLTGVTPIDSRVLRGSGYAEIPALIEQTEPLRPSESVAQRDRASRPSTMGDPQSLSRRLRHDLDWIVMKCLEKDRNRRYDSASALAADLERYLANEPVEAGPPSASYRLSKFVRRHRGLVAAASSVGAVIILGALGTGAGLAWALHEQQKSQAAEVQAQEQAARAVAAREEAEAVTKLLLDAISSVEPGVGRRDMTVIEMLRRAELEAAPHFAGAPALEARVRRALGTALWELGYMAEAERHLARSLEIRLATVGEDDPDTLLSLSNVASVRLAQGDPLEAERLYKRAIDGYRRTGRLNTAEGLGTMNNLAATLDDLGRIDESIELQRETLGAQRLALGPEHPNVLGSMANLASLVARRGEFAEAEALLTGALDVALRTLGDHHPDTLLIRHKLGLLLEQTGRRVEAERVQRAVLEASIRVLGPDHPDTIGSRTNLAITVLHLGRADEAEAMLREAMAMARTRLGERHATTMSIASTLLSVFENLGWPERTHADTADLIRVVRNMAELPGATADDLNTCAWLLLTAQPERVQDPPAALALSERSCRLERAQGAFNLWMFLDTLALARSRCGRHAEAAETQREAIALLPPDGEPFRAEMEARLEEFERLAAGG